MKCRDCNGCLQYRQIRNRMFLYCDFCRQFYEGTAGKWVKIEAEKLQEYMHMNGQ